MNTTKLTLEPNIPLQISLASLEPKIIWEGTTPIEVQYKLVDGRNLYLPIELGASIMNLALGDREPFFICRYSSKDRAVKDKISVWLTPAGEKHRAALERDLAEKEQAERDTLLERQLAGSIHEAQAIRKPPAAAPAAEVPLGAGTTGPVPVPRPSVPPALHAKLLAETNHLITVYSEAVKRAEELGVPAGVVRSLMLSAYIGLNQRGGRAA